MAYYLSMQRVRFRSADDYAQFSLLFSNVSEHLKKLPGLPSPRRFPEIGFPPWLELRMHWVR
jgi:hypothetical protein